MNKKILLILIPLIFILAESVNAGCCDSYPDYGWCEESEETCMVEMFLTYFPNNYCISDECIPCTPEWTDITECEGCIPTECESCLGLKEQSDGCGNEQTVDCTIDEIGCPPGEVCDVTEQCTVCGSTGNNADINRDGIVNDIDYALFTSNYNTFGCANSNNWCSCTDINQNGQVEFSDFSIFTASGYESSERTTDNWCGGADIDRNTYADVSDYSLFAVDYDRKDCGILNDWCDNADITQDGNVDNGDFHLFGINYNQAGCTPLCTESNSEFCTRLNIECGSYTADDICGEPRTVNCGTCISPQICIGNICVSGSLPDGASCTVGSDCLNDCIGTERIASGNTIVGFCGKCNNNPTFYEGRDCSIDSSLLSDLSGGAGACLDDGTGTLSCIKGSVEVAHPYSGSPDYYYSCNAVPTSNSLFIQGNYRCDSKIYESSSPAFVDDGYCTTNIPGDSHCCPNGYVWDPAGVCVGNDECSPGFLNCILGKTTILEILTCFGPSVSCSSDEVCVERNFGDITELTCIPKTDVISDY